MHALIHAFWQIILFRNGPDSLPYSRPLLLMAGGAYGLVSLALSLLAEASRLEPAPGRLPLRVGVSVGVDLAFEILFLLALVFYCGCRPRFHQALCAVFGVGALQGALLVPCVAGLLLAGFMVEASMLEALATIISLAAVVGLLGIVLWSLAVYAHILARTLSKTYGIGMALAALSFYLNYQFMQLVSGF